MPIDNNLFDLNSYDTQVFTFFILKCIVTSAHVAGAIGNDVTGIVNHIPVTGEHTAAVKIL